MQRPSQRHRANTARQTLPDLRPTQTLLEDRQRVATRGTDQAHRLLSRSLPLQTTMADAAPEENESTESIADMLCDSERDGELGASADVLHLGEASSAASAVAGYQHFPEVRETRSAATHSHRCVQGTRRAPLHSHGCATRLLPCDVERRRQVI